MSGFGILGRCLISRTVIPKRGLVISGSASIEYSHLLTSKVATRRRHAGATGTLEFRSKTFSPRVRPMQKSAT